MQLHCCLPLPLLVFSGGEDGVVRLFDLRVGSEAAQFPAADDTGALGARLFAQACPSAGSTRPRDVPHLHGADALLRTPCNAAVNGVAFHPFLPLLATASGQRRYFLAPGDESDSSSSSESESELDGEDSSMAAADSGSEGGHDGTQLAPAAAAAAAGMRLSPRENVLQVWQCAAQALQLPADAAAEAAAAGDGEEAEVAVAADMDEQMADGPAEAAIAAAGVAAEQSAGGA